MGLGNSVGFNFTNNMLFPPMTNSFSTGFDWNNPNWGVSSWGNSAWTTSQKSTSSSNKESAAEYEARIKKEIAEKAKAQRQKTEQDLVKKQEEVLEKEAWNILEGDYVKTMRPSESFFGAAAGGAAFGVMQNPRTIAHPYNTLVKGFKDTKTLFNGVKESGTALNTAWKANAPVMEEAYAAMQKLSSRHNSKLGLFRHSLSDARYKQLKNIMEQALRPDSSGKINIDKVAEATAKLKHSYVNDGYIPRAWKAVKGWFGGTSKVATVSERLGETEKIAAETAKILEHGKDMNLKTAFKSSGGLSGAVLMAGVEVLMSKGKIESAFAKDSETGWTQVGQTALKAGGSAVGWAIGQSLGTLAWAKLGASVGTCFGPGVGTAIGAVVGLVAGSIGTWAVGKLTHWISGDDVADKLMAENKSKTAQGKLELLQNSIARAQSGEIKDEKTLAAIQGLAAKYSATA